MPHSGVYGARCGVVLGPGVGIRSLCPLTFHWTDAVPGAGRVFTTTLCREFLCTSFV
jgi:hypothetical protein